MSYAGGFSIEPEIAGHNSPKIRKSDDLPHPFGPVIIVCIPGLTSKEIFSTIMSAFGEMMGTSLKIILFP